MTSDLPSGRFLQVNATLLISCLRLYYFFLRNRMNGELRVLVKSLTLSVSGGLFVFSELTGEMSKVTVTDALIGSLCIF